MRAAATRGGKICEILNRSAVDIYTVGQDYNFDTNKKLAAAKLRIFAIRKIDFTSRVLSI
jgi:hypothetical protein